MTLPLLLGTRGSPLALVQANLAKEALLMHGGSVEIMCFKTTGDRITHIPLYDMGGKALFSKELEKAVFEGSISMAVHSLKDLETPRPEGLMIGAYLPRGDVEDVCVTGVVEESKHILGMSFMDLPKNACVGTCSPRRAAIIQEMRPDIVIDPIRGLVETRLSKLQHNPQGKPLDAVILAKAGLSRLGYTVQKEAILPPSLMPPAAGQGIIAIECRMDDASTRALLQKINCPKTARAARMERAFVETCEGNCRSAIGVHVDAEKDSVYVFLGRELNEGKAISSRYTMDEFAQK